jgi:hypothetical protein
LANALEREPIGIEGRPVVAGAPPSKCSIRDAVGPPENAALSLVSEAAIAQAATRIDGGESIRAPGIREIIEWEHKLLDLAIDRMDAVEKATAPIEVDARLQIDSARLQVYLRRRTGRAGLVIDGFRPALGGRSRQTALFSVMAEGVPPRLVVQRARPGMGALAGFNGPDVEFRPLEALHRVGQKVPRGLYLEMSPEPLGAGKHRDREQENRG